MAVQPQDILYHLSGGSLNADPNESLGNNRSNTVITDGINNLFDNVSGVESAAGHTDYRCFYILNSHTGSSFRDVRIWVDSEVSGGSSVLIGIGGLTNELQRITLLGSVGSMSGTFVLGFGGEETNPITYSSDLPTMQTSLTNELNGLDALSGAQVVASSPDGNTTFYDITFAGADGNKNQPTITVNDDSVTGGTFAVSITENGHPINVTAPDIGIESVPPTGISFVSTSQANPIIIGTLSATDTVPVWVKRQTISGVAAVENDGFTFKVQGTA